MTSHLIPPAFLQDAVGQAEHLGRDFETRPLSQWEADYLATLEQAGYRPVTAGAWLAMPTARQLHARVAPLPVGGGPGGGAA